MKSWQYWICLDITDNKTISYFYIGSSCCKISNGFHYFGGKTQQRYKFFFSVVKSMLVPEMNGSFSMFNPFFVWFLLLFWGFFSNKTQLSLGIEITGMKIPPNCKMSMKWDNQGCHQLNLITGKVNREMALRYEDKRKSRNEENHSNHLFVGFHVFFLHCWSVFVSAGWARPAPTSLVTTLMITY